MVMPRSVQVAPAERPPAPRWQGGWLPAGDLALDEERDATISFDRRGRCRLTLALDRPATAADVAALEEAADVLPNLYLFDLDDTADYPERHAEAFGLAEPLAPDAFNQSAEVELLAPPGGQPLPRHLGRFAVPAVTPGSGAVDSPRPSTSPSATLPNRGPGTAGAPRVERAPLQVQRAPLRFERALLEVGRRLVAATRVSASGLCALALGVTLAVFVVVFTAATWTAHARFGTYGFDVGIYDQGTWLLSRARAPFVTVRGLDLLGQHAAYIMVLVAPLYRVWADPRLLLLLQVVFLALPAVVLYRLGGRHLGHPAAGLAVAVAYLAYPGVQWAISWQFHPEAIAAGLLALAVAAADQRRHGRMALWLALAALCGGELGLVVAGFGLLLVAGGRRAVGWRTAGAGLAWFLLATYLLAPLHAGRVTRLFETDYGIAGTGPRALLASLATMAGHALQTGLANDGLFYLLLVFLPLLGLPLLAPRWLLPVAPPLLLNLAAVQPEHHQLRFHYLATAAPLLAAGAVAGLAVVRSARRQLARPPAGPAGGGGRLHQLALRAGAVGPRPGGHPGRADRPGPARGPGPGRRRGAGQRPVQPGPPPRPPGRRCTSSPTRSGRSTGAWTATSTRRRPLTGSGSWSSSATCWASQDRELLDRLQTDPAWRTLLDRQEVVVLERREAGG